MEVTNRLNGLDLIDRVPEELWMEVHDILQEAGIRPSPRKRNEKSKWLSETLQIAVKRREAKGKGEKERYTYLHAEIQRIEGEIRKPSSVISAKK